MSNKAIMIGDNYRICPYDDKNVVVQKYHPSREIVQKGKSKIVDAYLYNLSYHANIQQAVNKILNIDTNLALEDGLQAVLDKMNEFQEYIKNLKVVDI